MAVDKSNLYKEGSMSWVYGGSERRVYARSAITGTAAPGPHKGTVIATADTYYIYCGACGSLNIKPVKVTRKYAPSIYPDKGPWYLSWPVVLLTCFSILVCLIAFKYTDTGAHPVGHILSGFFLISLLISLYFMGNEWLTMTGKRGIAEDGRKSDQIGLDREYEASIAQGTQYECQDCHAKFSVNVTAGPDNPKRKTRKFMEDHNAFTITKIRENG